ncbi:hypothetical protein [Variovorax rhizosphaerae]|uniref:TIGR02270 family protein n=1 Tax=Variovorax rhizosphaerae TaxID=1836200 RepID=A0ABU8WP54_9BURK
MYATLHAFTRGLHEEHLQEISLLFEQRQALRLKPDFNWLEVADIEERIEAHLDALLIGGELALEVSRRAASEGDFGEIFGAIVLFCRQQQAPLLAEALRMMDFKDPKKQFALAMALRKALPTPWASFVEQALTQGDARLIPVLAAVSGHLRLPHGAALLAALRRSPEHALPVIEALGRLREASAEPVLRAALQGPDAEVSDAADLALWRMGRGQPDMPATPLTLAVAGGPATATALRQRVEAGHASPEEILALGILGHPPAWRALYDCLGQPELAEVAAIALQWSTGADLQADVFVPEEVDEQALFKDELQAWQQYKQAPVRLDGQPFGEVVNKPVTDPVAWQQWFEANAARFDRRLRYHKGRPCAPATWVASLQSPRGDARVRRYAALEMEIRYGCPVRFEVDMDVIQQRHALRAMEDWSRKEGARFQPGHWYLHGAASE